MALFEIAVCRVYEKGATIVDRTTVLGNPFVMYNESGRDRVCDEYQTHFDNLVKRKDPQTMNALRSLFITGKRQGYLKLGCHCSPKRCHADTIANFLKQDT
jgi:hypothetical protein